MARPVELEVSWARRGWPDAQALLAGEPVRQLPGFVAVSWYDSTVSAERGAFAVVAADGPLADLVGDILRVRRGERFCFAYVYETADVPTPLALYRHAFSPWLGLLALDSIDCLVEVVA